MDELNYPVRINKYLAVKKYCTRRKADELISAGKVKINGRLAVLGDKVAAGDKVEVDASTLGKLAKNYVYLAYNKPAGIMTHGGEVEGKDDIGAIFRFTPKVFPVGRLDQDSHGLIILTNDGRVTDRLLNPARNHEKEYYVQVNSPLKQRDLTRLTKGVKIEDGLTKPTQVFGQLGSKTFRIILTEGKRHQIRRMVTALGYEVIDLQRVRIMNIKLDGLKPGEHRKIEGIELVAFLKALDL